MPKRILLPLDRREDAGLVARLVAQIARGEGATVRLLHVSPLPENRLDERDRVIVYASQEMERLQAAGLACLEEVERVELDGVSVESVVRFGNPAREILLEAEAFGADLIAMATANGTSLRRVLRPGASKQVVRKAKVPVLLLHQK